MKNPYLNILMQIRHFTQTQPKYEYYSIATVITDIQIPYCTRKVATAPGFLSINRNYENHVAKALYRNLSVRSTYLKIRDFRRTRSMPNRYTFVLIYVQANVS